MEKEVNASAAAIRHPRKLQSRMLWIRGLRHRRVGRLLTRMAEPSPAPADFLLVFSTFPDFGRARETARTLVGEQLAACANILPGVTSLYVWQGEQTESEEVLVLFKTRCESYPAMEARLKTLHPYEVPEIIAADLAAGLPAYLEWVAAGTRNTPDRAAS